MTFTAMSLGTWVTLFASIGGIVTLLYLLRLRRRRIEVPFGPLWQKVLSEKQSTSLMRVLNRIFSLLMQLAFIALVLAAIADPKWTGEATIDYKAPRQKEPSHTLLVVDTSASMKATDVPGGRMAAAIDAGHRVIDAMTLGENVMVARMDRDMAIVTDWTNDSERLHKAINEMSAVDAGTDVGPLMQFARNTLRGLSNPQVVLITDSAFTPPEKEVATSVRLKVISVGTPAKVDNVAVLDFNVRSHLGNALKYAMYYKIKNYSERPTKVAAYLYSADSGRVRSDFTKLPPAKTPVIYELGPGEEKVVEEMAVDLPGRRAALIIEPVKNVERPFVDMMPADDVAYAVVPRRKEVKVQLVGPTNLFVEAALVTRSNVVVDRVAVDAYRSNKGYDLTVFNGVAPKADEPGSYIYVNSSGPEVPYKAKGTSKGGKLRVVGLRRNHPLMKFVRFVDLKVPELQRIKRRRGDVVMARGSGGRPAILAHSDPNKRWIAIGFDPIASEWVGHYSFSIFFVNAVNWFFSEEARLLRPWSLAERWDVRLPWRDVDNVNVTLPNGKTVSALVDAGGTLAYTGRIEGIYKLEHPNPKREDQREGVLVAAALKSASESALTVQGKYDSWEAPEAEKQDSPKLSLMGADLWQLLVLAGLILMTLEWFTYHRRWTV